MGRLATSSLPPKGPQRIRARDKIRSGPHVGRLATSPLPSKASPTLHGGRQNQQWPTHGQIGFNNPAMWGVHNASERRTK